MFDPPGGSGAWAVHVTRRCPACAGLLLANFVANAWIVLGVDGVGNPAVGAANILPVINSISRIT